MKTMSQNKARNPGVTDVQPEETDSAKDVHEPRHLTLRENVILAIKVFALAGVLGAALWGINLWTSAG